MTEAANLDERDEYLSFRLGKEEYAIDILKVQEIRPYESVTRIPNMPEFIKGVINLRGTIVPIADLRLRFAMDTAGVDQFTVVIILNIGKRTVGVVVDAVSDVVSLAPGDIRAAAALSGLLEDGFIRGLADADGRMLIVMDISRLMMSAEMALVPAAA
jgi:purine-binding chemotaxis protein CheW